MNKISKFYDEHPVAWIATIVAVFALYLWTLLLVVGPRKAHADEWSPKAMNRTIDDTNVLVNRGCSGTMLENAYILTAFHCIRTQYEVVTREKIGDDGSVKKEDVRVAKPGTVTWIQFRGAVEVSRRVYRFKVVASDSRSDLAMLMLQVDSMVAVDPVKMACSELVRGDAVYAVGNSFGVLYATLSRGIVSSVNRSYESLDVAGELGDATDDGEHGLVQHTAVIAPGNSGGALYNAAGEFVGVNVRGGPSGFSFAVPMKDIQTFLQSAKMERLYTRCQAAQE